MSNKSESLSWDFLLTFEVKPEQPEVVKVEPRLLIKSLYPHISERIESQWGTIYLHWYLENIILNDDRDTNTRKGFPYESLSALLHIQSDNLDIIKKKGLIRDGVWDVAL